MLKVTHLLTKWGALDDVLLRFRMAVFQHFIASLCFTHVFSGAKNARHVLEGLKLSELESLNNSGYLPDKFNAWKSCAAPW